MDPEDGHLWVYDTNDRQVPAFTEYRIAPIEAKANTTRSRAIVKPPG